MCTRRILKPDVSSFRTCFGRLAMIQMNLLKISNNTDLEEGKIAVQSPKQQGYNPEEYGADWDTLSDMTCSTIHMTLSSNLVISYESVKPASKLFLPICNVYKKNTQVRLLQLQEAFWTACHDPNQPIAKWIARLHMAATNLASVKLTPADHQVCGDRLVQGLDNVELLNQGDRAWRGYRQLH
jgi:hypothetical protein